MKEKGTLYLCATPIGNLEDITYRALRILKEVDLVAAEDTRHTKKLFNHFEINTQLISYHEHNKESRGPELIEYLLEGKNIAIVSDAGIPGISDPGTPLVELAIEADIKIVPIPGANAALSALICSGLDTTTFMFIGFLPKTKKHRKKVLESIKSYPATLILYESPHRILDTLEELAEELGDRKISVARELTKKFEEHVRGTIAGVIEHFKLTAPRGEFCLIIEGHEEVAAEPMEIKGHEDLIKEEVGRLVLKGLNKKDAIKQVASKFSLNKREVYQLICIND